MGGTSREREVSLESGRNVAEALASLGLYEVVPVVLETDDLSALPENIDAVYIALHGGWGEDGGLQAALDARGIPYTGPGATASRAAMDKIATKKILEEAKIPTAPWTSVCANLAAAIWGSDDFAYSRFGYPVVVKTPRDGSSHGVILVKDERDYNRAVNKCIDMDTQPIGKKEALIEAYIPGREMTVGVIDGEALPAVEIITTSGWYGFDEKYKSEETRYPFVADSADPADHELEKKLQALACDAYRALGCRSVTRVDFRVAPDGQIYVLELNTSPGFTAHSLVPKAGMRTGLTFAQVCDKILQTAKHD